MAKLKHPVGVLLLLVLVGCGEGEATLGRDPITGEGVEVSEQNLVVDDIYAKLREAENLVQPPPPTQNVLMGTLDTRTNQFTGRTSTVSYSGGKPRTVPPVIGLQAMEAVLVFNITGSTGFSVVANGQTFTTTGTQLSVPVGAVTRVNWSLQAVATTAPVSDVISITHPVVGVGAFTVSALPITIVYEPPQNLARTNFATVTFRQEMTTLTTISKGQSNSHQFEDSNRFYTLLGVVESRLLSPNARAAVNFGRSLLGTSSSTNTTGTTVNTDHTLGITQASQSSFSTFSRLGPGRGDVVVFYKRARLAWVLIDGQVSLTLLDHGPMVAATVDALKNDLAAARAGAPAPITGLDTTSLEALIALDPLATTRTTGTLADLGAPLSSVRFARHDSVTVNGVGFSNLLSHTITQSDTTSTTNTSSRVTECHSGWLSVVGLGETRSGTFTSTLTYGASRTDTVTQSVSTSFNLYAAANESYTLDVHYDRVFGAFLTRPPPTQELPLEFGP